VQHDPDNKEMTADFQSRVLMLARGFPQEGDASAATTTEKNRGYLMQILEQKGNARKYLTHLANPATEYKTMREARSELPKALGGVKGPLLDFGNITARVQRSSMPLQFVLFFS
jgi:hypothetical protein